MTQKELTCICCPIGCSIQVEMQQQEVVSVKGNNCPRGEAYARREMTNPSRTVTTTVKVAGGERPVVSIKTATEIPKEKIMDAIRTVKNLTISAPVHIGDIIAYDVAGTGINMVATSNVEKAMGDMVYSA